MTRVSNGITIIFPLPYFSRYEVVDINSEKVVPGFEFKMRTTCQIVLSWQRRLKQRLLATSTVFLPAGLRSYG